MQSNGNAGSLRVRELLYKLQDFYLLSWKGSVGIISKPFYFKDTIEQMDYAGAGSFPIVVLISLFTGMALSLQISAELSNLGLKMYTGKIVGIAIIRELGPVVTAVVYAGRVGSGIASELGSMVLGHQVDTLRVFGVDPTRKLVTPRIVTALLMLPVLTIIGDAVSLIGGYYISVNVANQSGTFYWSAIRAVLNFENVLTGIVKPFVFGFLIATICCFMGLSTQGGAVGMRRSTTRAVVYSMIFIVITDFVLTRALLYVLGFSI